MNMNKNRKTLLWLILVALVAVTGYWGWRNNQEKAPKEKEIIKIGAILPLTGEFAAYGTYMKQGIELALKNSIDQGVVKPGSIKFIFEDSQANPQLAVNAFNKMVSVDSIIACIPATSGVTLAIKHLANKKGIILVNATAISNDIEDLSDYVYSTIPNARLEGYFLSEYVFSVLNKRSVALIYRNDASGKSFEQSISEKLNELGVEIVYKEAHQPNSKNFAPLIDKIIDQKKSIDAVFVMSFGPEVAQFVKQAHERGMDRQIITYETFHSPVSLEIAKEAANGVIFCSPSFDENSTSPEVLKLKSDIYRKYDGQREFNYFIAAHYDAANLLIEAISKGNKTSDKIKAYFDNMKNYNGVTGQFHFLENGSADIPLVIYIVQEGEFNIVHNPTQHES